MGDIFDKACEELVIGQECFSNALLKRAQTESLVALELEGLVEQEAPSPEENFRAAMLHSPPRSQLALLKRLKRSGECLQNPQMTMRQRQLTEMYFSRRERSKEGVLGSINMLEGVRLCQQAKFSLCRIPLSTSMLRLDSGGKLRFSSKFPMA